MGRARVRQDLTVGDVGLRYDDLGAGAPPLAWRRERAGAGWEADRSPTAADGTAEFDEASGTVHISTNDRP